MVWLGTKIYSVETIFGNKMSKEGAKGKTASSRDYSGPEFMKKKDKVVEC